MIAFDAATSKDGGFVSSTTVSHTTTGINRLLTVVVHVGQNDTATVTALTYGGVALTQAKRQTLTGKCITELWSLANPPSGANTVSATLSTNVSLGLSCISLTGVDQVKPIGNTNGAGASATSVSTTVVPTHAASYIVTGLTNSLSNDPMTATSHTERLDFAFDTTHEAAAGTTATASMAAVSVGWSVTGGFSDDLSLAAMVVNPSITQFKSLRPRPFSPGIAR
jgi:hypothetical protein